MEERMAKSERKRLVGQGGGELLPDAAFMDDLTFDAMIWALDRARILVPPTRNN
jgi:hypothetical protein